MLPSGDQSCICKVRIRQKLSSPFAERFLPDVLFDDTDITLLSREGICNKLPEAYLSM